MTKIGERLSGTIPLQQAEIPLDTVELARFLLGKLLIRHELRPDIPDGRAVLRIVETEAYPPGDPAAHHFRGVTARNRSLFLSRGHAYVYRAYGVCWMLNVSSETEGVGAGVLIRAGAPEDGIGLMAAERGGAPLRDVARGPGRLAQALGVDRSFDGRDLCVAGNLFLASDDREAGEIGESVRIGITRAADRPWRFFLRGSRFVSGPARLNANGRFASAPEGDYGGER